MLGGMFTGKLKQPVSRKSAGVTGILTFGTLCYSWLTRVTTWFALAMSENIPVNRALHPQTPTMVRDLTRSTRALQRVVHSVAQAGYSFAVFAPVRGSVMYKTVVAACPGFFKKPGFAWSTTLGGFA